MENGKNYKENEMTDNFENFDFIGKQLSNVEQFFYLNFRIASKDGQSYILTCDFVPNRFNFHVNNGIITSFTKG